MAEKRFIDANGSYTLISMDNTQYGLCFGGGIISVINWHGSVVAEFYADDAPAADVAPVVHARWITEENTEGYRGDPHCTACKGILDDEAVYGYTPGVDSFFYCPLCGAKMDGGKDG